jgi:fatty-acyl-CoA synthase
MITGDRAYWETDNSLKLVTTTVGQALRDMAERSPDVDALRWMDRGTARSMSYAELLHRAASRAQEILSGASPGDCVAVWAPNSVEWVVLEYGSALAGTILVALNPAAIDRELEYLLSSASAVRLYTVESSRGRPLLERARAVASRIPTVRGVVDLEAPVTFGPGPLPEVRPSDPLIYQYTSGTTGDPKGAILSHQMAYNAARMYGVLLDDGVERQVSGAPLPYHHVAGSVSRLFGSLAVGGTHVVVPSADLAELAATTVAFRVTHGGLVAKLAVDLLEEPALLRRFDGHCLRTVAMGGAGIATEVIMRVEDALGVKVVNGYGQSESPHITLTVPQDADEDRWTTIGRPVPLRDVCILRPDATVAALGEVGEICTRGPLVMDGYLRAPEKTAAAFADGWLHTGDLGSMDERGYLRYSGRAREMIIRGGENIYPAEVEARLAEHEEILEVVVVPVPDLRWGEQVLAYVRLAPGSTLAEDSLRDYARSVLAPFKVPSVWKLVDDFPRTAIGKVKRAELVSRAAAEDGPHSQVRVASERA